MPAIPVGLIPTLQSYSVGAPDGVQRIPVGGGMPRYSMQWDQGPLPFRVQMVLDGVQFAVWSAFFHYVIRKGAIAFDMPIDSGAGMQTHTVNILPGSYQAARTEGSLTTVSFTVEAPSAAYGLSDAAAQALIVAYNGYADPAGLPQIPRGLIPITSGYSIGGPDGLDRTSVAGAAPRYANDWDRDVQQATVTLVLTPQQFWVWTLFLHHTVKKGAAPFLMQLDTGLGAQTHTVQMLPGTYSATATDGTARVVSFTVEAESSVYSLSYADGQSLVDAYNAYGLGFTDLLARIAQFANVDTLGMP